MGRAGDRILVDPDAWGKEARDEIETLRGAARGDDDATHG